MPPRQCRASMAQGRQDSRQPRKLTSIGYPELCKPQLKGTGQSIWWSMVGGAPLCAMPALARPDTIRTWTALQRRGKTDDRKLDWTYVSRTLNAVVAGVAKVRCPPSFRFPLGGRSADGLTAATGWNVR